MNSFLRTLTLCASAVALTLSVGAAPATAQTSGADDADCPTAGPCGNPDGSAHSTIGARLRLLRTLVRHGGPDALPIRAHGSTAGVTRSDVGALLRFRSRLTEAQRADLAARGVELAEDDDGVVRVGNVYLARVQWEALGPLASYDPLVRAEASWTPSFERPLEVTGQKAGATQLRSNPEFSADGEGTVIADIDSSFYIFHPHMFRADGGWYEWIDTNANDAFDPGTDGVDLDEDGTVDDNEVLRVLDGTVVRGRDRENEDGELQPRRDWLYIDENGDRERNVGPGDGFTEADPAYGEPLFVVDDADRDGDLETPEKLVRLDSSKFQRILADDREFVRGEDLIEYGPTESGDRSYHGTGVASILAGGQPRFHDRVGLAPAADLAGYPNSAGSRSDFGEFGLTQKYIDDAIDAEVDVLLHEWTDIMSTPQDGSTNLETSLDTARSEGIVQVNPLGNLNLSKKHVEQRLDPGDKLQLNLRIDSGYRVRGETRPYYTFWSSLRWRTDQRPTFELIAPSGESVELQPESGDTQSLGPHEVTTQFQVSPRGTRHLLIVAWNRQNALAEGLWTLKSSSVSRGDRFVGRVTDRYSSWNVGIRWEQPTRDRGTITFPATADSAFGVAAYGGRRARPDDGAGSDVGELRNYSGRGPRIDGARTADIVSPDDPLAAFGVNPERVDRGYGRSWFRHFGGTSGAGPHVAASFAMLGQLYPSEGPEQLETRLTDAADPDGLRADYGSAPNRAWGYGKLDVYEAASGNEASDLGERPVAALEARAGDDQLRLDASASRDPEGERLEYRFDFEYDGAWDTDWSESATASTSASEFEVGAQYPARVAVRDPAGNRHGAIATFRFEPDSNGEDGDAGADGDAGTDAVGWKPDGGGPTRVTRRNANCAGCATSNGPRLPSWLAMGFALLILRRRRSS